MPSIQLRNPVIIEGFPGAGAIGPICASYLAEKLEMEMIGYIESRLFPPIASIHNYKPMPPARIYANKSRDIVVIFSEFIIPSEAVLPMTRELLEFANGCKAKLIISLAGIATDKPTGEIYGVGSTPQIMELMRAHAITPIREGATQGVSGVLAAECAHIGFPALNLLTQTSLPADLQASGRLLKKIGELLGFEIDTTELLKEAEELERRTREALEQTKLARRSYRELETQRFYV